MKLFRNRELRRHESKPVEDSKAGGPQVAKVALALLDQPSPTTVSTVKELGEITGHSKKETVEPITAAGDPQVAKVALTLLDKPSPTTVSTIKELDEITVPSENETVKPIETSDFKEEWRKIPEEPKTPEGDVNFLMDVLASRRIRPKRQLNPQALLTGEGAPKPPIRSNIRGTKGLHLDQAEPDTHQQLSLDGVDPSQRYNVSELLEALGVRDSKDVRLENLLDD